MEGQPARWSLTANNKYLASGDTKTCPFKGDITKGAADVGMWLPHCGASAFGTVYSNEVGEIEFSWHLAGQTGDMMITLSGFSVYKSHYGGTVTTTSTAVVAVFVDETDCSTFSTDGWTVDSSVQTADGKVHG